MPSTHAVMYVKFFSMKQEKIKLKYSRKKKKKNNRGSILFKCPSFKTRLQDLPQQSERAIENYAKVIQTLSLHLIG